MSQFATVDEWISREAVPLDVASSGGFAAAVEQMLAALGESVELLGLGEALHGGEEILQLRNRLFQHLAAAHGFSAIAVESSFTRGTLIDDYVHGRGRDSYDAVRDAGFSHQFGKLDTSRELVEWMRAHNADPEQPTKLRFYGFDGPMEMMYADSPRHVLSLLLDDLSSFDAASAERRQSRIHELLGDDAAWENPAAAFNPSQAIGRTSVVSDLQAELTELWGELTQRWSPADGDEAFAEAAQNRNVAAKLLEYHAVMAKPTDDRIAELLGLRDALMADNVRYIAARERGRGRVLVFAHNHHLKCGPAEWQLGPNALKWNPAGVHLRNEFGSRYAVIGTGVATSEANGIGTPEVGTLEARLTASGGTQFIPTHGGTQLPADAIAALTTRSGSKRNGSYFPLGPQSFSEFDALLVLDTTGYSRGGPTLPG